MGGVDLYAVQLYLFRSVCDCSGFMCRAHVIDSPLTSLCYRYDDLGRTTN